MLKNIRKTSNMKLSELAQKVGVTKGFVSQIESGISKMPGALIPKFAEALGVSEKVLRDMAEQAVQLSQLKKSWVSQININGHPLIEAFAYHLVSTGKIELTHGSSVQRELIEFVKNNISHSLAAELGSNKNLLPLLIKQVNLTIKSK